jgi:eukaryotic-like serine/threonine-protein kinase
MRDEMNTKMEANGDNSVGEVQDMKDSQSDELGAIIAEYLRSTESGKSIDMESWIASHPGFESELRSFVKNHLELNQFLEPLRHSIEAETLTNPLESMEMVASDAHEATSCIRYFGDYQLLNEVARGGMGVVFRARQMTLDRIVAVKMILEGRLASPDSEARFQLEAQAAASLDHPNIVPIYEIGENDGQRYFSMKFLEGSSLSSLRQKKNQPPIPMEVSVKTMVAVAHAVHHAHQRGILHRDIKPGNILIDTNGIPHVTDFGLAKRFEGEAQLTHSNALLGTPSYMAPEQARGDKNLTTAADIFSIGAVLFEMIFGEPPHKGPTPAATIAQILSSDSIKFPNRSPTIDADLETILWKCLQFQPEQRYESAAALAGDLECWLDGKPISARRSTVVEQLVKWARRKPAIASLTIALALTLIVSMVVILHEWRIAVVASNEAVATTARANTAEAEERSLRKNSEKLRLELQKERDLLDRTRYLAQMQLAGHEWRQGSRSNLKELLEGQVDKSSHDPRSWEWYFLRGQLSSSVIATGFSLPISKIAWDPSGQRIAASGYHSKLTAGILDVIDAETGTLDSRFGVEFAHGLNDVAWSPDGKWIATGGGNVSGFTNDLPGFLSIFDAEGRSTQELVGHMGVIQSISWSPDSQLLAAASGNFGPPGQIKIWNAQSGQITKELKGLKNQAVAVAWSPNQEWIAGSTSNGAILIWDAASGDLLRQWKGDRQSIRQLRWSPDSALLVTDNPSHGIKVWNQRDGSLIREIRFQRDIEIHLDWLGNRTIEVIYNDGHCVAVDIDSENTTVRKKKGMHFGNCGACNPDKSRIAFLQANRVLSIEPLNPEKIEQSFFADSRLRSVQWSPDGKSIATSGANVSLWNASTLQRDARFPWPEHWRVSKAVFSPDGSWIATSSLRQFSGTIHVLDVANQKVVSEWNGHLGPVNAIAWSLDCNRFATMGFDNTVRVWNARKADELVAEWSAGSVGLVSMARHPTQDLIAVGCDDGNVAFLDIREEAARKLMPSATRHMHKNEVNAVRWNHDGTLLATSGNKEIKLWAGESFEFKLEIHTHSLYITSLAFRPPHGNEPARLASLASDKSIGIWDVDTGREALNLPVEQAVTFDWSLDGERLVVAKEGGECVVWDAGTGRNETRSNE